MYQAFQNGHFFEMGFLDLQSAYDSVWVDGLLYRMINDYNYDGNIIAWYIEYLKGRKTRVKYKNWVTNWKDGLENLLQGQTDSTILFDLMLNYINLNDVDKIIKDLKMEIEEENYNIGKKYDEKKYTKMNDWNREKDEDITIQTNKRKITIIRIMMEIRI